MPTFEEIIQRVAGLGYPIAENEFVVTKKNPAPSLPFICYQRKETYTGTDQAVRLKTTEGFIEFYTDRKPSTADKAAIAALEATVFPDIEYVKEQAYIRDENMTQTAYSFTTYEKIRKES